MSAPGMLTLDSACALHAQEFLARTTSDPSSRFSTALGRVLPQVTENRLPAAERILSAYLLHAIYSPVSIELNPFRSALADAFARERALALNGQGGRAAVVWVLWKLVRGQGAELDGLSPNALALTPLADEHNPARLDIGGGDASEEPGISHSGSLVNPDDSFVGEHNAPAPAPVAGVIGQPKATSSTATTPKGTLSPEQLIQGFSSLNVHSPESQSSPDIDPVARALELLASACVRVLTLAEQRTLKPHLPTLAAPVSLLNPPDLASLVQNNPSVGADYIAALLSAPPPVGTQLAFLATAPRTPSIREWMDAIARLPPFLASFDFMGRLLRDETPVAQPSSQPAAGSSRSAALMGTTAAEGGLLVKPSGSVGSMSTLSSPHNGGMVILPGVHMPTQSGFSPLQPSAMSTAGTAVGDASITSDMVISPATSSGSIGGASTVLGTTPRLPGLSALGFDGGVRSSIAASSSTVGEVARADALGGFISGCIAWIEMAERDEREGLVADDRVARGVAGLSRFFISLLKLRIVDPRDDAQTAEMSAFALAHSRFEEALSVYRMLARQEGF
ncbi:hypothetical protein EXIGLDRAFT_725845 [Exidia glandulosa HHB12029]|uniref:Uncharacterized protein n=1 Tax=Exidia glandulosa HHB12029 TaxID=1314781 RepID=A0A165MG12_EXIGL|nr:hypothetical protein EXIGLDRAFT_725845 [Exidia glandulosa HHB12029]